MSSSQPSPLRDTTGSETPSPPSHLAWIEYGSTAVALAVLVQAVLAGQIVSGDHSFTAPHRVLAEFLPLAAIGLALLPWIHRRPGRDGLALALVAGAVLVVIQTGLGFAGRESAAAIAVHVPVGTAILGVYVGSAATARSRRLRLQQA